MKFKVLLIFTAFILISCSKNTVDNYSYKYDNWICYVYDGNKPFDGEIWSNDKKSAKLTIDCGVLTSIDYYNKGGKVYCTTSAQAQGETFYNEKCKEISREQFRELYREQFDEWRETRKELEAIIKANEKKP